MYAGVLLHAYNMLRYDNLHVCTFPGRPHTDRRASHTYLHTQIIGKDTEVYIKLELFQMTGTFKARGALNNVLHLTEEQKAKGVTACSAGNHAIATAFAAKQAGVWEVMGGSRRGGGGGGGYFVQSRFLL